MRTAFGLAPLAAVAAAALAACSAHEDPAAQGVRAAVIRYDAALVDAFRSSRADGLRAVATESQVSRDAAVIAGLARQDRFMVARQDRFRVEKVVVSAPARAEVDAEEAWTYEHRALGAPDAPVEAKTLAYRMKYRLEGGPSGWRVSETIER